MQTKFPEAYRTILIGLTCLLMIVPVILRAQTERYKPLFQVEVHEVENTIFKQDKYWRGADGAASIELDNERILWLFSDTFVDQDGTGRRSNARTMIRNSIAIQKGRSLSGGLTYYYQGTSQKPQDFFEVPGASWFWTGHGVLINGKLVIFLTEETTTDGGVGFEAVGWYVAIVDNPSDSPDEWLIRYQKGPDTYGVIVGSSAVLSDEKYVYAFGVKEPATHETYLLRFEEQQLAQGNLSGIAWWVDNTWTKEVDAEPVASSLFTGFTEFSVHYDESVNKYVQIQTFGFGRAGIGYRLSDKLEGPWSEAVIFYTPTLEHPRDFVYTANSHPEFTREDGLVVTYNVNNGDVNELLSNENIYFPLIIKVKLFE